MAGRAFFGRPAGEASAGGTHVAIYLAPVFEGQLVLFEVARPASIAGRWLPWDVLDFQGNPYECASALAEEWCGQVPRDLSLVDVMSFVVPGEGWELAIIFRAEIEALPPGDDRRRPVLVPAGRLDAVGNFDPADLERWVGTAPREAPGGSLVF